MKNMSRRLGLIRENNSCCALALEARDVNVGTYSQINEHMMIYDTQGQGHSVTFVQGHTDATFS